MLTYVKLNLLGKAMRKVSSQLLSTIIISVVCLAYITFCTIGYFFNSKIEMTYISGKQKKNIIINNKNNYYYLKTLWSSLFLILVQLFIGYKGVSIFQSENNKYKN